MCKSYLLKCSYHFYCTYLSVKIYANIKMLLQIVRDYYLWFFEETSENNFENCYINDGSYLQ